MSRGGCAFVVVRVLFCDASRRASRESLSVALPHAGAARLPKIQYVNAGVVYVRVYLDDVFVTGKNVSFMKRKKHLKRCLRAFARDGIFPA